MFHVHYITMYIIRLGRVGSWLFDARHVKNEHEASRALAMD
jgi:hypothetical protein